ncbi:hypothetical protein BpHYR1_031043, partial [Brachionus plicatilis]
IHNERPVPHHAANFEQDVHRNQFRRAGSKQVGVLENKQSGRNVTNDFNMAREAPVSENMRVCCICRKPSHIAAYCMENRNPTTPTSPPRTITNAVINNGMMNDIIIDSESDSSSTSIIQRSAANNVDDTDNESEDIVPPKKTRGQAKVYDYYKKYKSLKESLDEIENELIDDVKWSSKEKYMTDVGEKRFFRCSKCDNRLYILVHRTSIEVTIYKQDKPHEHNNENDRLIPTKTKDKVISMYFNENKKAKEISRWLRKIFMMVDPGQSIDALKTWAESVSIIPEGDDEMFVVSKFVIKPDDVNFRIFMTTKRLICLTIKAKHVAADTTHKLNWINFPVLLCGTTDKAKAFHPFAMLLSRTETHEDFEFMFKIVEDINFFQASVLKEHFETVYNLLKTKWTSRNVANIINMFDHCDQYWLSEYHLGWYEGYADGYPSTNNALESTNDVIKKEATLRDRLPL